MFNHGEIPLLPHITDTRPTMCDVTEYTAAAALLPLVQVMSSDAEDLDRCLSYALQWLVSPELKCKPEQWSVIESVYRGRAFFVWLLTGCGKLICYHTLLFVFESKLGHRLDWHKQQALSVDNIIS